MKKLLLLTIFLLLCTTFFCQTKHTFSFGSGTNHLYNGMLTPYNWSGFRIIGLTYGNENRLNEDWKSFFNIGAGFSSLTLDYNFANKLKNGQPFAKEIDFFINKSYLRKVMQVVDFDIYVGGLVSAQGVYQVAEFIVAPTSDLYAVDFFQIGVSGGLFTSLQLKWKSIIIRNTTSYLLLGALLYPNYTGDSPFYNGTKNYLTFATIDKRNFIENRLGIEFPLYIRGKFINNFSLYHDFKYEHSTLKDNIFTRFEHTFNMGVIFKIEKPNKNNL